MTQTMCLGNQFELRDSKLLLSRSIIITIKSSSIPDGRKIKTRQRKISKLNLNRHHQIKISKNKFES